MFRWPKFRRSNRCSDRRAFRGALRYAVTPRALVWVALLTLPAWAFAAMLVFTPLVLGIGGPLLLPMLSGASGEPLAQALRTAGAAHVRYEDCYSPGTDFLLGQRSVVVSATGEPLSTWKLSMSSVAASRTICTVRARTSSRTSARPA